MVEASIEEYCHCCGGRLFGKGECIVCGKKYLRRRPGSVTCSIKCRAIRRSRCMASLRKNERSASWPLGDKVKCYICEDEVFRKRISQITCGSTVCLKIHKNRREKAKYHEEKEAINGTSNTTTS